MDEEQEDKPECAADVGLTEHNLFSTACNIKYAFAAVCGRSLAVGLQTRSVGLVVRVSGNLCPVQLIATEEFVVLP